MGIFKKSSPAQDLFSLSNRKIMPGFLQHPNGRFIWFPSTGNAGPDVELFQVSYNSATSEFKVFAEALMSAVSADPGKLEIILMSIRVQVLRRHTRSTAQKKLNTHRRRLENLFPFSYLLILKTLESFSFLVGIRAVIMFMSLVLTWASTSPQIMASKCGRLRRLTPTPRQGYLCPWSLQWVHPSPTYSYSRWSEIQMST